MKFTRWLVTGALVAITAGGLVLTSRAASSGAAGGRELQPVAVGEPGPAPAGAVAASQGASVNQDAYTVSVLVPAKVAAGKEGLVTVAIAAKPGWKLNQEFPTKLVVTAPSGVTLKKDKLRTQDATVFSEKKGSFPVVFTASSAGAKSFAAKLRFAVCTDSTCDPKTEELRWAVTVE